MASALDILIRLVTTGAEESQAKFDDTAQSAQNLDSALAQVGSNDGLNKASEGAKGTASALDAALEKCAGFRSSLDSLSIGGQSLKEIGGKAKEMSGELAGGFLEADRLSGKLNSLMSGKGLQDGIGKVQDLGAAIAGLTGGDDDAIAASIGAAIASGKTMGLKEYGIILDDTAKAAIDAAGDISEHAKSQEILNQVLKAGGEATKNLKSGMDASTASLGEFAVRAGNVEENFGKGSAAVKAALTDNILSPLLGAVEAVPGLQSLAGGVMEVAGVAGEGSEKVGGLLEQFEGMKETVGKVIQAYASFKDGTLFSIEASETAAGAADTEAAAHRAAGAAAVVSGEEAAMASGGHDALARSQILAAEAAGAEGQAARQAGAASVTAGEQAALGARGFDALAASAERAAAMARGANAGGAGGGRSRGGRYGYIGRHNRWCHG